MTHKTFQRISYILMLAVILSTFAACGNPQATGDTIGSSDSMLLLVKNNALILYDTETSEEYVIDAAYTDDNTLASALCTRAQFSDDGEYVIYFSKPDDRYQLNIFDWADACVNPEDAVPTTIDYDVSLDNFQIAGDSIGYVSRSMLKWYSLEEQYGREIGYLEGGEFYISETGELMLVHAYGKNEDSITLFTFGAALGEYEIESGSDVSLLSYTTDLSEIVTWNDSELYLTKCDGATIIGSETLLSQETLNEWGLNSPAIPLADANTVCARPYSADAPTTLLLQDGEIFPLNGQVQIYSTDKFRSENRSANRHYGSLYHELLNSDAPIIGFYCDDTESTEYIFTDDLTPFQTSLDGNFTDATYDPTHNILYWCAGSPKKGYSMYAYSIQNNRIVDETLISDKCKPYTMTFDSNSGTLFYFEKENDTDTGYTLHCILDGSISAPHQILSNVGSPLSQHTLTANGALQFEDGTGRVFCWTDVDEDLNTGTMYEIEIGKTPVTAKIGEHTSYMTYGTGADGLYYIGSYFQPYGGTLYRADGNSVTEVLPNVQGIIPTHTHHSNYSGFFN